jgi:transposase
MIIIGVDYHPSFQAIALCMEETGECGEQELSHSDGQTEKFYQELKQRGIRVRIGMEATGYSRWFERLLAEWGFELWIGDPAEIQTKRVKKQKTDRNDARLLRKLMLENNFPQIWVPSPENRDLRQLLRRRLVQMRTRIMNQLQALAMNEGYRWKKKLFSAQGRALLDFEPKREQRGKSFALSESQPQLSSHASKHAPDSRQRHCQQCRGVRNLESAARSGMEQPPKERCLQDERENTPLTLVRTAST